MIHTLFPDHDQRVLPILAKEMRQAFLQPEYDSQEHPSSQLRADEPAHETRAETAPWMDLDLIPRPPELLHDLFF